MIENITFDNCFFNEKESKDAFFYARDLLWYGEGRFSFDRDYEDMSKKDRDRIWEKAVAYVAEGATGENFERMSTNIEGGKIIYYRNRAQGYTVTYVFDKMFTETEDEFLT